MSLFNPSLSPSSAPVRRAASLRTTLEWMTREIGLAEAIPAAAEILAGQVRGRLVVDVNR